MSDEAGGTGAANDPTIITEDQVDAEFAAIAEAERLEENVELAREAITKLEAKLAKEQAAVASVEEALAQAVADLAAAVELLG